MDFESGQWHPLMLMPHQPDGPLRYSHMTRKQQRRAVKFRWRADCLVRACLLRQRLPQAVRDCVVHWLRNAYVYHSWRRVSTSVHVHEAGESKHLITFDGAAGVVYNFALRFSAPDALNRIDFNPAGNFRAPLVRADAATWRVATAFRSAPLSNVMGTARRKRMSRHEAMPRGARWHALYKTFRHALPSFVPVCITLTTLGAGRLTVEYERLFTEPKQQYTGKTASDSQWPPWRTWRANADERTLLIK